MQCIQESKHHICLMIVYSCGPIKTDTKDQLTTGIIAYQKGRKAILILKLSMDKIDTDLGQSIKKLQELKFF